MSKQMKTAVEREDKYAFKKKVKQNSNKAVESGYF